MELRHLKYFLAVAKEGNMTRAAELLGIAQPPLSMQIKQLEQELEVVLFQRTSFGVVLTAAGKLFAAEANRIVDNVELAKTLVKQAAQGEVGQLRIGFTGSATFNPLIPDSIRIFKKHFPAVALTLEETNTPYLLQKLTDNRLDIAFIRPISAIPENIQLYYLPAEEMRLVLPTNHRLAKKKLVKIKDLIHESFILVQGAPGTTLYSNVYKLCLAENFTPKVSQPATQISSVVNLVAAGLGISIVPASLSQRKLTGVCYRSFAEPIPTTQLALAWVDQYNGPIQRLLDIIKQL